MKNVPDHFRPAYNAILEIFPAHKSIQHQGGMLFEINGVGGIGNCNVILSVMDGWSKDRIYYLVQTETHLVHFRVCDAAEGSGYAKFAVVHSFMANNSLDIGEYADTVVQQMKRLGNYPEKLTYH